MKNPAVGPCDRAGRCSPSCSTSMRALPRRPFQTKEFIQQCWFIASVTIVPTALVSIPFGAVIALQVGTLTRQLGAQSFTGAASVLAVVREASPIATALLIAGAGGSAICADLGSRKIREELDAMEVLGHQPDPAPRRARACWPPCSSRCCSTAWCPSSASPAATSSTSSSRAARPAPTSPSFTALAQLPDLWTSEVKALIFGFIAAIVASYKGLTAGGGPKGVGDAVNQTVVITFMFLFVVNFVISAIYFQVVPQKI